MEFEITVKGLICRHNNSIHETKTKWTEFLPVHAIKPRMGLEKQIPSFIILALTRIESSNSLASCLTFGEESPATHYIGYSVGLRASLEVLEKNLLEFAGDRSPSPITISLVLH